MDIEAINEMNLCEDPLVKDGPVGVNDLAVLLAYFLVQTVELAKNADVKVGTARRQATWRRSVSKTDPMAWGAERSWGGASAPSSPPSARTTRR